MSFINNFNPWEMGSEVNNSGFNIPNFTLAKYIVLRIVPPKGKTVRDGVVMSAAMLSFTDESGIETKTVEVVEGTSGYEVMFPHDKRGLLATKYRGPKSQYKFINPGTGKFYQIANDKFTTAYAAQYLSQSLPEWVTMNQSEKDAHIDEYLENMYMFGLSNDFAFDNSDAIVLPRPGMVTMFYRRYTPPEEGEKYGNTIITKWPKKSDPVEGKYANLTGDYVEMSEAVALAIYDALQKKDQLPPTFDPTDFPEVDDDDLI